MRTAIVADVHSNLEALETVLRHAEEQKALEQVWCLGDTVGYGPEPNACLALLRRYNPLTVPGNHDLAAIGLLSTEDFNPAPPLRHLRRCRAHGHRAPPGVRHRRHPAEDGGSGPARLADPAAQPGSVALPLLVVGVLRLDVDDRLPHLRDLLLQTAAEPVRPLVPLGDGHL